MDRTTHHVSTECFRKPRDWERADIGTSFMACITCIDRESLCTLQNFSTLLGCSRDTVKGHARAHRQIYPTIGLPVIKIRFPRTGKRCSQLGENTESPYRLYGEIELNLRDMRHSLWGNDALAEYGETEVFPY